MGQTRVDDLLVKLEKGHQKTTEYFSRLTPEEWQLPLYNAPEWCVKNLLAHFVSAEKNLLELSQNVVANGPGAPAGFDINRFNAQEQLRLKGKSVSELLEEYDSTQQRAIDWVRTLEDSVLDKIGRHPALGFVSVEAMLTAIYGHQILHMRDLMRLTRQKIIQPRSSNE